MAARFPGAAIYIEDKANGTAIVDFFKAELVGLTPWDPGQASKYSRAEAKAYLFETGRALVPPDSVAPWVADYAATLQRFPLAKHDDDVDATTMALLILDSRSARSYAEAVAKMAEDARGGASRE
jgi:predicted phage terminase large subunit-like protein